MTLSELYTALESSFRDRVVYNAFPIGTVTSMPYICIVCTNTENFGADDKVYYKRQNVNIELYTDKKDLAAEGIVESVLDNAGIFYNASDTYIDDEKCFERIYEIEV